MMIMLLGKEAAEQELKRTKRNIMSKIFIKGFSILKNNYKTKIGD